MSSRRTSTAAAAIALATVVAVAPVRGGQTVLVTGEPFMVANANVFTIQGTNGEETRNRATTAVRGVAKNLFVVPSGQPGAGSFVHACLRVDGVDTSLCVDYAASDWPLASKGNTTATVTLAKGSLITVHFTETANMATGVNFRASLQVTELPAEIFSDGFENGSTSEWSQTVGGGPSLGISLDGSVVRGGSSIWGSNAELGSMPAALAAPNTGALIVTGEPFMLANQDTHSIGGSNGSEDRNRAGMTRPGTLRSLFIVPNLVPAATSQISACLMVNGVDSSVCVSYTDADGTSPKGNTTDSVAVNQGDRVTVHFTEDFNVASGVNVRASFEVGPVAAETVPAMIVTHDPFIVANANDFSIGGSAGSEARNRAAAVADGTLRNLFIVPSQQPAAGSQITACVRVNGVDSNLCVSYTAADGSAAKGNTVDTAPVSQGDLITVHFMEDNGVATGANVRASFDFLE